MASIAVCDGLITVDADNSPVCVSGWSVQDHNEFFINLPQSDYLELSGLIILMFVLAVGIRELRGVFANPGRN